MDDKRYKKRIWIFSVIAVASLILFVYADSIVDDIMIAISSFLMSVSVLVVFINLGQTYEINPKLEKRLWLTTFLLILVSIFGSIIIYYETIFILPLLVSLFIIGSLVFLPQRKSVLRLSILLLIIIAAFTMKRFHIVGSSMIVTASTGCLAAGSILFGFKIVLKKKQNIYHRIIISICSFLVSISGLAIMFKYNHYPGAGLLIIMSTSGVLVMTLFVLITLPSSGFINWGVEQKRNLTQKILIPWIFILLLFALRTLLPLHLQQAIFERDVSKLEPFEMDGYHIELKEGMEEGEVEGE